MDGSRETVLSADGTRIGFRTAGTGSPLLLVHGGMCSGARWAPLWPLLTRRFRVTAMDRRGRGSSADARRYSLDAEYADVIALVEHLARREAAPVDVLGHSYGAVCALGAAARGAPLRRLALYEPPGPATVTADWLDCARGMVERGELGRAMGSFLVEVVGLRPDEVDALRDRPGGEDPMPIVARTLVREAEALTAVDLPGLAAGVTQPVLLLLGTASPLWAAAVTQGLAAALPTARLAMLPGHGHEAVDAAPALVAAALEEFLC